MTVGVVAGVGEFHPQRRSGLGVEEHVLQAIKISVADAGLCAGDIEAVVTESSITPQMAPLDRIAVGAGLCNLKHAAQSSPVGAGILGAVGMAFDMVKSGKVKHALVYFGVDWGTTPEGPTDYHKRMGVKKLVETPAGFVGTPLYFAVAANRYQHVYGLSEAEMQAMLRHVVQAARYNASHHNYAQKGVQLTEAQYLAKAMIAEPLRSVDCSLLSDGAVAVVVSSKDANKSNHCPVGLKSWAYSMDPIADMDFYSQSPWLPDLPAATRSSSTALKQAGMAVTDIDMFQVYDCFSIAVILQLEALGLCKKGQGKALARDGAFQFDGRLPVNTHGGLLAHGYLLGAAHVSEAIQQLRYNAHGRQVKNAKTAFVGAGPGRQYTSLIFQRMEE